MRYENLNYTPRGRIAYTPEYHAKTGSKWSKDDLEYLINWYNIIGIEEMTFALERAGGTIMTKVNSLRRKGLMKPTKVGRRKVS